MQLEKHADGTFGISGTLAEKGLIVMVSQRYGEPELKVLECAFNVGLEILRLTLYMKGCGNDVERKA